VIDKRESSVHTVSWRKSSRSGSGANGANCVEVAEATGAVQLRDTKHPHGGILHTDHNGWTAMLTAIKRGNLES
jgi:hypothetical protein